MLALLVAAVVSAEGITEATRLAKPIAIAEYAVAAPQVCADLSKLSGVPLSCDSSLNEDLIILVVRNRPTLETMAKLADTFGWEWWTYEQGYRLFPTTAFTHTALHGRDKILLEEGHEMQASERKGIGGSLAEAKDIYSKKEDRFDPFGIDRLAQDLTATLFSTQFCDLDDQSLLRYVDHRLVFSFTKQGPYETPMSERTRQICEELIDQLHESATDPARRPQMFMSPGPIPIQIDPASISNVLLRFGEGIWTSEGVSYLNGMGYGETPFSYSTHVPRGLVEIEADGSRPKTEPKAAVSEGAELRDQLGRTRAKDIRNLPPSSSPNEGEPLESFAKWLAAGALKLDLDVAADAYDDEHIVPDDDFRIDVSQLADFVTPRVESGWLVNRVKKWPKYREQQIPRPLLRYFSKEALFKSLDERGTMASAFTPAQKSSPLFPLALASYSAYKLWDALPSDSRDQILKGKSVPLDKLPNAVFDVLFECGDDMRNNYKDQLSAFLFFEPEFKGANAFEAPPRSFEDWMEDLTTGQGFKPYAVDFAAIFPSRIAPDARVWAKVASIPSVFDSKEQELVEPFSLTERSSHGAGPDLNLATTRAIRIHFELRKDLDMTFDLAESSVGRKLNPDRSDWPADLLTRVARWNKIDKQQNSAIPGTQSKPPSL